jgi:hypothetical protein
VATARYHEHLTDTELLEFGLLHGAGQGHDGGSRRFVTPGVADFVGGCPECETRLQALTAMLAADRLEAEAEADRVFTSERLAEQRAQIRHKLEQAERPARVITFPAERRPPSAPTWHPGRWVAAAAVAGLLVGLTAGRMVDRPEVPGFERWASQQSAPASMPLADESRLTASSEPALNEERLLGEIEDAIVFRRVSELEALDAFTPRAAEPFR